MAFNHFINQPFIDLSSEILFRTASPQDTTRVSQLLLGEKISIIKEYSSHLLIKAFSQPIHCKKNLQWQSYSGWILNKNSIIQNPDYTPNYRIISHEAILKPYDIILPFGSLVVADTKGNIQLPNNKIGICNLAHLRPIKDVPFCINTLQLDAAKFMNIPYLWGGRSFNKIKNTGGVDCSGFIHLIYGAQGFYLPRDAKDQFLACKPVSSFNQLPIGGCIFIINNSSTQKYINHVMLKNSPNTIIESSFSKGGVIQRYQEQDFQFNNDNIIFNNDLKEKKSCQILFGIPLLRSRQKHI